MRCKFSCIKYSMLELIFIAWLWLMVKNFQSVQNHFHTTDPSVLKDIVFKNTWYLVIEEELP